MFKLSSELPIVKVGEVVCELCQKTTVTSLVANGWDFEYQTCQNSFNIVKCSVCGLQYLNPRPDITELSVIYPSSYEPYYFDEIKNPIIRYARNFVQKQKVTVIDRLVPHDATIIDVGCGSGALLRLLKEFGSPQWQLYGNDFSEISLRNLAKHNIKALSGRFEDIDTSLKFDLIILNQAIEHLDSPSSVIAKASQLVKPQGSIFIETPSTEGFDTKIFGKRYWGGYHFPRHWTLFNENSLKALVAKHGFETISVEYLASPAFWIQSVHHIFLERGWPLSLVNLWTLRNPLALAFFTSLDIISAKFTKTSNMRLVARKQL